MNCHGCKKNILNQLAHLDGCLRNNEKYELSIKHVSGGVFLASLYLQDLPVFVDVEFSSKIDDHTTAYMKTVFKVITYCKTEFGILDSEIKVVKVPKAAADILNGKCKTIGNWSFHLNFKKLGTELCLF
jgi:hypothetical protein